MNNPFQMMRAMQNPQELLNQMISSGRAMQDPRAQRAISMYQNHDTAGLQKMAENLCKEYGITTDEARNRIMKSFGLNK